MDRFAPLKVLRWIWRQPMRFMLLSLELRAVGLLTCVMALQAVSRLRARQVFDVVLDVAFAVALMALWRAIYHRLQAQEDAVVRAVTDAVVCAYRVERRHGQWGLHNLNTGLWTPFDEGVCLYIADPTMLYNVGPEE